MCSVIIVTATFNDYPTISGNFAVDPWALVGRGLSAAVCPEPSPPHSPVPAACVQALPYLWSLESCSSRHGLSYRDSSVPCTSPAQQGPGGGGAWVAPRCSCGGCLAPPESPLPAGVWRVLWPPRPTLPHPCRPTEDPHPLPLGSFLYRRLCSFPQRFGNWKSFFFLLWPLHATSSIREKQNGLFRCLGSLPRRGDLYLV